MKLKTFLKKYKFNIIVSFLIIVLCCFFPYTHDDWAWGSQIGLDRLNSKFINYNGRWAGNIVEIILTRNRIIKIIVESITIIFIVIVGVKILDNKNKKTSLLFILTLLAIPLNIIAQSIAWIAGFSNYVIPTLLTLIFILYNKKILISKDKPSKSFIHFILLFILGFINALFVEHITTYNIILCIFIFILELIKTKKTSFNNFGYYIGTALGAVVMFSNSAYNNILNSNDGYRTINISNIFNKSLEVYFNNLYEYVFLNNLIIVIFIAILSLILIKKIQQKNKKSIVLNVCATINVAIISYLVFNKILGNKFLFQNQEILKQIEGIFIFFYLISLIIIIIKCINKKYKLKMLFYLSSTIVIALPLLVVTPIGPRCFFPIYIFETLFLCELYNYLNIDKISDKILQKIILFVILLYLIIYSQIFYVDRIRIKYINDNKDSEVLYLPKLPYENYMQNGNPANNLFKHRFKLFYNINEEKDIQFIEFREWKNLKK